MKVVPCVALGDRHLSIYHVDQLAAFLGLPPQQEAVSYDLWAVALERVLETIEKAVRMVPSELLWEPTPNRSRDLPHLAVNIHGGILAMQESLETGRFDWDTSEDYTRSRHFKTRENLAKYCSDIRTNWFQRACTVGAEEAAGLLETNRGPITRQQVLEAQARHAAQHLRQIYVFLRQIGLEPGHELTAEEMWPIQLGDLVF